MVFDMLKGCSVRLSKHTSGLVLIQLNCFRTPYTCTIARWLLFRADLEIKHNRAYMNCAPLELHAVSLWLVLWYELSDMLHEKKYIVGQTIGGQKSNWQGAMEAVVPLVRKLIIGNTISNKAHMCLKNTA